MEFLFVYTNETRLTMGSPTHELPEALSEFAEPPGVPLNARLRLKERVREGKKHFGLRMPCLIDNEQGEVQRLYGARPKRLLIVDLEGRIALDSGNAPSNAFPWTEVTDWLNHYGESVSRRPG